MRRTLLVGVAIVVIAAFFLAPLYPVYVGSPDTGKTSTGWESLSYATIGCGIAIDVGHQVQNGGFVSPSSQSSVWSCG